MRIAYAPSISASVTETPAIGSSAKPMASSSGLDRQRRHHRAGDDDLAGAQPLAERRQQRGDVAHDSTIAGIGLRLAGARDLGAAPDDPAGQTVDARRRRAPGRSRRAPRGADRCCRRGSFPGPAGGCRRSTSSIAGEMPAIAAVAVSRSASAGNIAADMDRDLRLRHRRRPSRRATPCRRIRLRALRVKKPTSGPLI